MTSSSSNDQKLYLKAALLGVLSGMRSMSGPAQVVSMATKQPDALEGTPFAPLVKPEVGTLLNLAALGEMVVDKLSFVPSRTAPPLLMGRALLGSMAGAVSFVVSRKPPLIGAAIAAVAAVASSYVFGGLRVSMAKKLHVPDLPLALVEDALVLALRRVLATFP